MRGRGERRAGELTGGREPRQRAARRDLLVVEGWRRRYVVGGGGLRALDLLEGLEAASRRALERRLEQTLLAVHGPEHREFSPSAAVSGVVGSLRRTLQRGSRPPPDPATELALLQRAGFDDMRPPDRPGGPFSRRGPHRALPRPERVLAAAAWGAADFRAEPGLELETLEEGRFFRWVQGRCGANAARWLSYRVSPEALAGGRTPAETGAGSPEPPDFVFAPPWGPPLGIEIERRKPVPEQGGPAARPATLEALGLAVERVPGAELLALQGPQLDRLARLLKPPAGPEPEPEILTLLYGPALATRLGLAVAAALERGWLGVGTWSLAASDPLELTRLLLRPLLELVAALDGLLGGSLAPARCELLTGRDHAFVFERTGVATYEERKPGRSVREPSVEIRLELDRGPLEALPSPGEWPVVVARASALPLRPDADAWQGELAEVCRDARVTEPCLARILSAVFAKQDFLEGQLDALHRLLARQDCVAHLPSGGGKSLVYQLAGLLAPGRTVVVVPTDVLAGDHLSGLAAHGIDRAECLDAPETRGGAASPALFLVTTADRIQESPVRRTLADLADCGSIGRLVVDEAHSVSEWGHDFRLGYPSLGLWLRQLGAAGKAARPPVLALTGTASRRVLRDILALLGGRGDADALVAAASGHRDEHSYEVLHTAPDRALQALSELLAHLPRRFGLPEERFFAAGGGSPSGIVFCAQPDGPRGPESACRHLVERLGSGRLGVLAPPRPEADSAERESARQRTLAGFRRGHPPLLIATPEVGVGIDVPRLRYVVHFGFPGSVEAYAQQVGRAAHGGGEALCTLLYVGRSAREVDRILDRGTDQETALSRFRSAAAALRAEEDLCRHLDLHFAMFPGRAVEMEAAAAVLEEVGWAGEAGEATVSFDGEEARRERALYRLSLVGAVDVYAKESDRRRFLVRTASATAHRLDAAFLAFVERARPSRVLEYQQHLARLEAGDLRHRALELLRLAVDLVYEAIEPARRESLLDMWRLVREAPGPQAVERQLDSRLLVERLAPRVERLVESGDPSLLPWLDLLTELTVQDADELQQAGAPLLAAHPEHPGLLLADTVARLFRQQDRDGYLADIQHFVTAARGRSAVAWPELGSVTAWLARRARQVAPGWAVAPWIVWEAAGGPPHLLRFEEMEALEDGEQAAGEAVVVLARRLGEAGTIATALAEHYRFDEGAA